MLTFGQIFDIAYRLHHLSKLNDKKSKDNHLLVSSVNKGEHHRQLDLIRLPTKSDNKSIIMSSLAHSPTTSSSSSSTDDRKVSV